MLWFFRFPNGACPSRGAGAVAFGQVVAVIMVTSAAPLREARKRREGPPGEAREGFPFAPGENPCTCGDCRNAKCVLQSRPHGEGLQVFSVRGAGGPTVDALLYALMLLVLAAFLRPESE
jgi:hypothetical protein